MSVIGQEPCRGELVGLETSVRYRAYAFSYLDTRGFTPGYHSTPLRGSRSGYRFRNSFYDFLFTKRAMVRTRESFSAKAR